MAKFANNNIKNASINYPLFELNHEYNLSVYYKADIDP